MSSSLRSALVSASLLVGVFAGCNRATVGVNSTTSLPSDSANICAGHCESLGLQLSSVVVMANNVGCVCSVAYSTFQPAPLPPPPQSPAAPGAAPAPPTVISPPGAQAASSAAGGMAAILVQEEAAAAAAAQQRHFQNTSSN